ncbi:MAG: HNH endonuclease [Actinobacteria bacterium]|nr:HNH endonuclease [Actinomycetota bacterium]
MVIVRVDATDLANATGYELIDGIDQPVGIPTVRRMGASGIVRDWLYGRGEEILHWGRRRHRFTEAQKLALRERDGGCAFCGLPPGMTKAHHIDWWTRDRGATDLGNGANS